MTTRMLTAMLVLCGGVLLGAQADDHLFVNDPRPMAWDPNRAGDS